MTKEYDAVAKKIEAEADKPEGPYADIQLKGSILCADTRGLNCCEEKYHHICSGDMFTYTVSCPNSGKVFALCSRIRLVELTPEEAAAYEWVPDMMS